MSTELNKSHLELKAAVGQFIQGEISASDLKHEAAPFGIYQQRNELFMLRVRVAGGHITTQQLRGLAKVVESHNGGHVHLTSRQDIQLHDIAPENIYDAVKQCGACALPFKGGGGNTYRNILMSPDSGFTDEPAPFDVLPYIIGLNSFLQQYEHAFQLPRKYKIGIFAKQSERGNALLQDLGLIATEQNGVQGFEVYGGGGMGRYSALGVKLFDFIPAGEFIRCAVAMNELFYDHGNRENRNQARIRFIVKNIGEEKFVELFQQYFTAAEAFANKLPADLNSPTLELKEFAAQTPTAECSAWQQHAAVSVNLNNTVAMTTIYVPHGNLTANQLTKLANLAEQFGTSFVRLTQQQNMVLPLHRSALPCLYDTLGSEFAELDLRLKSFKGNLTCCIGATVCKIGILDSPTMADKIAAELDQLFPLGSEKRDELLRKIITGIKVSGCPNACSAHPAAAIGVQGQKTKIDGKLTDVWKIFLSKDGQLGTSNDELLETAAIPTAIHQQLLALNE
ncbi:MAG: nitrite/sulfite reductase [Victivallaceae bacterium]|nr:nitrite/sulfite reductase [Victivallaceae bacterium]